MDFGLATAWWLLAGVLVAVELLSGTFYLLALALGAAAAAIAAHAGAGFTGQLVTAALVGGGSTALWHYRRARQPRSAPAERKRDVNLDIGQTVRVEAWDDEGLAQVHYRGARWSARFGGTGPRKPGMHVIVALRGNQLELAPADPS